MKKYPNAKVSWMQEEHRNQGAYHFVKNRLRDLFEKIGRKWQLNYIGRKISSSTATGSHHVHEQELKEFLEEAL